MGSYRTYEEWKPGSSGTGKTTYASSYRTYEEWKLEYGFSHMNSKSVLTVPMRNGNDMKSIILAIFQNSSYRTYEEWKLCILEYNTKF